MIEENCSSFSSGFRLPVAAIALARILLLLTGFPLLFVFHVVDLLLVVESRLLTLLQPQHYAFWDQFDLWFVAVKFYHSFSVMALKQVLPLLLLWLQWHKGQRHLASSFGGGGGVRRPSLSKTPMR